MSWLSLGYLSLKTTIDSYKLSPSSSAKSRSRDPNPSSSSSNDSLLPSPSSYLLKMVSLGSRRSSPSSSEMESIPVYFLLKTARFDYFRLVKALGARTLTPEDRLLSSLVSPPLPFLPILPKGASSPLKALFTRF